MQSSPVRARPSSAYLAARLRSFGYAFQGLRFLLRNEPNARVHLAATVAVLAGGLALGVTPGDWRWLTLAIGLVWSAEAFNTAVEQLGDLAGPGPNDKVKAAKDVAAGAVLVAAIAAAAIGAVTFLPYLRAAAPIVAVPAAELVTGRA